MTIGQGSSDQFLKSKTFLWGEDLRLTKKFVSERETYGGFYVPFAKIKIKKILYYPIIS